MFKENFVQLKGVVADVCCRRFTSAQVLQSPNGEFTTGSCGKETVAYVCFSDLYLSFTDYSAFLDAIIKHGFTVDGFCFHNKKLTFAVSKL